MKIATRINGVKYFVRKYRINNYGYLVVKELVTDFRKATFIKNKILLPLGYWFED